MKFKLDTEEQILIQQLEKDEWKPVRNKRTFFTKLEGAAKSTMLKDRRMNIRIAGRDIELLKVRALEEGIPYQTLVSSVLHKFVSGKLVEKT